MGMFKRYKVAQVKKKQNDRIGSKKQLKVFSSESKSENDRLLGIIKSKTAQFTAFRKLAHRTEFLNENIEEIAPFVFSNLIECKNSRIVRDIIDFLKRMMELENFHKVADCCYDYYKSLFFLQRFPNKLLKGFNKAYKQK